MQRLRRNCYCDAWKNLGTRPDPAFPPGFCGICTICGEPGHKSYHPRTSKETVSWCNRCYLIEDHNPDYCEPDIFWHCADNYSVDDLDTTPDKFTINMYSGYLKDLDGHDSRLLINLANGIGINFWIRDDNSLEMSFGDPKRKLWAIATVTHSIAMVAIEAALVDKNLQEALSGLEFEIDYLQEYKP